VPVPKADPRPTEAKPRSSWRGLRDTVAALCAGRNQRFLEPSEAGLVFRTTRDGRGRPFELAIDVYRTPAGVPSDGTSCLLIHGGSFVMGSRDMTACRFLATRLVAEGITVASADYRLTQQGGVFPRPVRDVKAALAFWVANAARFGADPARVTLVGLSAGGALSLLALGWPDDHPVVAVPGGRVLATPPVRQLASIYGVGEFGSFRRGITPWLRRWVTGTDDPERWREMSPTSWCGFDAPLFQVHGDADTVVPVEQTQHMDAARRAAGKPVETLIYRGVPHAFFSYPACDAAERGFADLLRFIRTEGPASAGPPMGGS
jgi:acetyl esterase/lipase